MDNSDTVKTFMIPIQGERTCKKYNKEYGIYLKSAKEQFEDMMDKLYEMLEKTGDMVVGILVIILKLKLK